MPKLGTEKTTLTAPDLSASAFTQAPAAMSHPLFIAEIESKAKALREFIQRWLEIIQGGTPVKQLEPWARAYVLEAEKLLDSTYL